MKRLSLIFLVLLGLAGNISMAQSEMLKQKKERRKVWKRWNKNREAYNPYLKKKARNKPSAILAREQKRDLKKKEKQFKREARRAKRRAGRR